MAMFDFVEGWYNHHRRHPGLDHGRSAADLLTITSGCSRPLGWAH